ncbi:MAG: pilus assembly protein N-terminal domain-containing protein [Myxococcaceae bacterium]|jgi:hypothetical protein|nr:pilus assembly protein N-terminal domain-containing protein [Myxococcaceae bacterium]
MTPRDWELLSSWVDGALTPDEARAVEQRLSTDRDFALAAARLGSLETAARALGPTAADVATWTSTASTVVAGGLSLWWLLGPLALVLAAGAVVATRTSTATEGPATSALTGQREPRGPAPHDMERSPNGGPMPDASFAAQTLLLTLLTAGADAGPTEAPFTADAGAFVDDAGTRPILLQVDERMLLHGNDWEPGPVCETSVRVDRLPGRQRMVTGRGLGRCRLRAARDGGSRTLELHVVDQPSAERTLELVVDGATTIVRVPGLVRFSIGAPTVVAVERKTPSRLGLQGARAGTTTLEAWFADGTHRKWPILVKPAELEGPSIALKVKVPKVLSLEATSELRVDDPSVVEVKPLGKSVLLTGLKGGRAVLEAVQGAKTKRFVLEVLAPQTRNELFARAQGAPPLADFPEVLRLRVGAVTVIRSGPLTSFSVAGGWLEAVRSEDGQLLAITASRPLESHLFVQRDDGTLLWIPVVADR